VEHFSAAFSAQSRRIPGLAKCELERNWRWWRAEFMLVWDSD